jgi:hypothetical protein
MKFTIVCRALALSVCCLVAGNTSYAQEEPHIFTITTLKSIMPDGGSVAERDSLLSFLFENADKKNDKLISERNIVHYYTNDSQEWIIVSEYKNWADVELAGKMDDELMKKAIPDEKKRQEFNRKLGRYFPSHGDRILTERPKLRK